MADHASLDPLSENLLNSLDHDIDFDEETEGSEPQENDDTRSNFKHDLDVRTKMSWFPPGLYAPSGIDIMSILTRVVTRPDPKIELGPIDSSCAIVVCDTSLEDSPIIYCSEGFEALTGYQSHEIVGRNCRFLQSPFTELNVEPHFDIDAAVDVRSQDGNLAPGTIPKGTGKPEDEKFKLAVLRNCLASKEESQVVITNYRKDGSTFKNLLSIVPVSWSLDQDQKHYVVGFQADWKNTFQLR